MTDATTGNEIDPQGVDHPKHYNVHPSGVECIEIVRHMGFNLGNVVKYLWRDGIKDTEVELQDLKKAAWYLQDEIKRRESKSDNSELSDWPMSRNVTLTVDHIPGSGDPRVSLCGKLLPVNPQPGDIHCPKCLEAKDQELRNEMMSMTSAETKET